MASADYTVARSDSLSKPGDPRYWVIHPTTGEILDDAGGYGYKSIPNAHRGYSYKKKAKEEKKRLQAELKTIQKWERENEDIYDRLIDTVAQQCKFDSDFTPSETEFRFFFEGAGVNIEELPFSLNDFAKCW